jgi:cold shock protein
MTAPMKIQMLRVNMFPTWPLPHLASTARLQCSGSCLSRLYQTVHARVRAAAILMARSDPRRTENGRTDNNEETERRFIQPGLGSSLWNQENSMASMNGTVKRLVSDKGFGFIIADDGNEYFFHNSACGNIRFDELREGQAVAFESGQGPKGPRAENIRAV